jgi:hypothetical protein
MSFKDNLIAMQLKPYLNNLLNGQGEVLEIKIDTSIKKIGGSIRLNSEPEIITLEVERYEILHEDGNYFLHLINPTSSHEELLKKYLTKEKYPIPDIAANFL